MMERLRRCMDNILCLFRFLLKGNREVQDEYNVQKIKNGWLILSLAACLGLALINMYYMYQPGMNRTQLLSLASAVFVLLAAGIGFLSCLNGTLPASDPFGGKMVILLGTAVMMLHGSILLPTRYFLGRTFFFWDTGLLWGIFYYLLCNSAWLRFLRSERELDQMAESGKENPRTAHKKRVSASLCVLAFVLLLALPAGLSYRVYDDAVMEEARAQAEKNKEAERTPEYAEYEVLLEKWNEPKEYAMVYLTTLKPAFFDSEPVYEQAGVLRVSTEDGEITVFFAKEDGGVKLIQGEFYDRKEEDPNRADHIWVLDGWCSMEDFIPMQSEKGVNIADWQAYDFPYTRGGVSAEMFGGILESEENGMRKLTFVYSDEYLERAQAVLESAGIPASESGEQSESLLLDESGEPVEEEYHSRQVRSNMENFTKTKETVESWYRCRYLTRDADEAKTLYETLLKEGASVPDQALACYGLLTQEGTAAE